jgi:L-ascorbate metabolism protein UlaG (beta-lactamase superfamily)
MLRKIFLGFIKFLVIPCFIIVLSAMTFIRIAPQFGQPPDGSFLQEIEKSDHYFSSQFQNQTLTLMNLGFSSGMKVMYEWLFKGQGRIPDKPLPVDFSSGYSGSDSTFKITWFGHSAILLQIDGKNILIDPMLGNAASPLPFMTKRFPYDQSLSLESLPEIDAIIISHDHYDHLDYKTILFFKERVNHFYTPLGVGSHLRSWGVDGLKITELDWWQSVNFEGLQFIAAPARHFSGRSIKDRNKTQWASWVILGEKEKIYFSGDSGYGPHFREIGEKYGPFDFAMLECGQYNERWEAIHMMPEQTVQAALDLKCKSMMPIHWGAFNLSLHSWTDPVERVTEAASNHSVDVVVPLIGRRFSPLDDTITTEQWWRKL